MTRQTAAELADLLESVTKYAAGFNGRFYANEEEPSLGLDLYFIAKDCEEGTCDHGDCDPFLIAPSCERHIAEPLARLLNVALQAPAVAKCLREMVDRLEHALDLDRQSNVRIAEVAAQRDTAIRERDVANEYLLAVLGDDLVPKSERDAATAEAERMRPVYEASLELRRVESTDVPGDSIAELEANIPAAQRRSMVALTKWRGIVDADLSADKEPVDDLNRCAVCGWPLAESVAKGCIRGNCSQRPRPERLYAPERAKRESADKEPNNGG